VIETVLFDYGLTLVTFEYPRRCLLQMLERVRPWLGGAAPDAATLLGTVLEPLEADVQEIAASSLDEAPYWPIWENAWRRAGLEPEAEVLEQILDQEQRCWDEAVRLGPDVVEVLSRLRRQGLRTGICSNAIFPGHLMRRQLASTGLDQLVDAAVFSSEVGRRKPAPEIYLAALAALGASPQTTLFVGDRADWDYEAPVGLGMRAVLYTELTGQQPPAGVPSIRRLRDLESFL
jgi:HAD superfamily hydrolase (TIGR01509 family)